MPGENWKIRQECGKKEGNGRRKSPERPACDGRFPGSCMILYGFTYFYISLRPVPGAAFYSIPANSFCTLVSFTHRANSSVATIRSPSGG